MDLLIGFRALRGLHGFGDSSSTAPSSTIDPSFKRVMMYIFAGTRGGYNRARIVELLREEPMNSNRIAEKLDLDYKTVQHHLKLLQENEVVVPSSPKGTYGAVYFLTPYVEKHLEVLRLIWARFGQS